MLPKVGSVGAVFLIVLYIFTLFGNQIFPFIRPQSIVNGIDMHFRDFGGSLVSLIRVASGEQWFLVVGDISRERAPNYACLDVQNYEDFSKYGSTPERYNII